MNAGCEVGGCTQPVPPELREHALCLEHYLERVEGRARSFAVQFTSPDPPAELRDPAFQFLVLTAAKLAALGVQNPPADPLIRNRLLHVMLMLADLREQLDHSRR